jgi:hypothetical protein
VSWTLNLVSLTRTLLVLPVPSRKHLDFPLFADGPPLTNCPSASCATATLSVCSEFHISRRPTIALKFDVTFNYFHFESYPTELFKFHFAYLVCVCSVPFLSCLLLIVICVCMLRSFYNGSYGC